MGAGGSLDFCARRRSRIVSFRGALPPIDLVFLFFSIRSASSSLRNCSIFRVNCCSSSLSNMACSFKVSTSGVSKSYGTCGYAFLTSIRKGGCKLLWVKYGFGDQLPGTRHELLYNENLISLFQFRFKS